MAAIGLFFGFNVTIVIALISFLIGAVVSIFLLIARKLKTSQYIPFGPFIVIASLITIYVPFSTLFNILYNVLSLGLY